MPDLVNIVLANNYGAGPWEEATTNSTKDTDTPKATVRRLSDDDAASSATEVVAPVIGSRGHFGGPRQPRAARAADGLAGAPVAHTDPKYPEQEESGPVSPRDRRDQRFRSVPPAAFEPFLLQGIAS
jgi:hypothetical protein